MKILACILVLFMVACAHADSATDKIDVDESELSAYGTPVDLPAASKKFGFIIDGYEDIVFDIDKLSRDELINCSILAFLVVAQVESETILNVFERLFPGRLIKKEN